MKAKQLIMMLFILIGISVWSQTSKTPEERAKKQTEWMKANLKLTAAQEAPVEALNIKYAKKNEELKGEKDSRIKMKALQTNSATKEKELKTILTADQFKIYQAKKDELKEEAKAMVKEKRKA